MDLVGLLADGDRLRVFAAVVLGHESVDAIKRVTDLDARTVGTALTKLVEAGVVAHDKVGYHLEEHEIRAAARHRGGDDSRDEHADAPPDRARVLRAFVRDGRVLSIPTSRQKRLVVLDLVVQDFEPGTRYSEKQVNLVLGKRHADTAALRRYLVDEGFLEREPGGARYWRAGGTFHV